MNSSPSRSLEFDTAEQESANDSRRHVRRDVLRQIDYSPFPRTSLDGDKQLGLMLNESDSGLCMAVTNEEEVGSLLRVMVRGLHGHVSRDVVARVVWTNETSEGRFRLGLALLRETQPRMSRIRYEDGRRIRSTDQ